MIHVVCSVMLGLAQPTVDELTDALNVLERVDAARVSLDAHDEPLSQVVLELAAQTPVPLRADWPSLSRLGIGPESTLTLRINPNSGLTAMSAMALSLGDEFERPVFEVHAGAMVFTTLNGAASMRLTGVYDVRDLLADAVLINQLRDSAPMMREDDAAHVPDKDTASDPEESKAVDADQAQERPADARPLTPGEQLIMLITDHIDPEAWINFGGDRSKISERNGLIVLSAAPTVHRRLRSALELLRQASPKSLVIEATIVDLPRGVYERLSRASGPGSAAMLATLASNPEAVTLWRAADPVTMGATLETKSASQGTDISLKLKPVFDAASGSVNIDIAAATEASGDRRSVQTQVSLAGGASGTVIELPTVGTPEKVRLLLLRVQRQ